MGKPSDNLLVQMANEGVLCRGYGSLPKTIMKDKGLSITSKGLICFFYACSGGGNETFPGTDYIRECTDLGKQAYYKHRQILLDAGLISIKQSRKDEGQSGFAHNIYILTIDPVRYRKDSENEKEDVSGSGNVVIDARIGMKGVFKNGWGLMPRAVMEYSGLSIKSKALYGYLSCYASGGTSAFPQIKTICDHLQISKSLYVRLITELKETGLITVEQRNGTRITESGEHISGYGCNDYWINDKPVLPSIQNPYTQKSDTQKSYTQNRETQNPNTQESDTQKRKTQKQETQNQDAIKTTPYQRTEFSSIKIIPSFKDQQQAREGKKNEYKKIIEENTKDVLVMYPTIGNQLYESLLTIMSDACAAGQPITVRGREVPIEEVRDIFCNQLTPDMIAFSVEAVRKQAEKHEIRDINRYYLSTLLNSAVQMQLLYDSMIGE